MKDFLLRNLKLFAAETVVLCAFCAAYLLLSPMAGDALYALYMAYMWVLCPLVGGAITVLAAKKGMQPYLAMWALPVWPAVMQLILTGTALDLSAVVTYALIGLICAAAGGELKRRSGR